MHRRHKYDILVIFSTLALAVSVYLSVAKAMSISVPCDITGGCESVLSSKYSEIMGVPLSTVGIVYFSLILVTALLANHYRKAQKALTWFLAAGSLGSLVFLFLQFFVIRAVCQYCLLTDLTTILMFILDINIEHKAHSLNVL
ncbi:MAG: vitamin K epoxide reductase family protein [Candidatus Doudnabacteria bacterium]|nr:vitamin K epoxide reductase family protein [Candidatus Doudnabacteria bacterium]